jgi:secreted PhoX family phosphatase
LESNEIYFYPTNSALPEGHSVLALTANATGNIFFGSQKFVWNDEVQTIDVFLTLAQIDREGNFVFHTDITEHFEQYSIVTSLALDDRGNVYVQADSGDVAVFDSAGNYRFTVSRPESTWSIPWGVPIQKADGSMLFPFMTHEDG